MGYIIKKSVVASSFLNPFSPEKAIDGEKNYIHRWVTQEPEGWIELDLGCPCLVTKYTCDFLGSAGWKDFRANVNSFNIYASGTAGGTLIYLVDSVEKNSFSSVSKNIVPIKTRKIRLSILKPGSKENMLTGSVVNFDVEARPLGQNSNLINLTTDIGILIPEFKSDKLEYMVYGNGEKEIKIRPFAVDSNSIIMIDGKAVKSGTESKPVEISSKGDTRIEINAFAEDEITRTTYVLIVKPEVKKLSNLTAKTGDGKIIVLNPSFDPIKKEYVGEIEFSDDNFNIQSIDVIPEADTDVKITYKGETVASGTKITIANPVVGDNIFEITASKSDGSEANVYKVNIVRKHSLYIKSIVSKPGKVTPTISKLVSDYSIKGGMTSTVSIEIISEDVSTKITVYLDGTKVEGENGKLSFKTNISSAIKTAKVKVVSADGSQQKDYDLNISK